MRDGHWRRIDEVFHRLAESAPDERPGLLADLSSEEPEVRRAVEALLAADQAAGSFLDGPALRLAEPIPEEGWQGRRLGPYWLREEIGRGGMGRVFLAERSDGEFDQTVAVKLIQGHVGPSLIERFRRERQILAHLEHPNIARLIDGGTTEEGIPYLVLEYVEGRPIGLFADQERLGIEDRLELFLQVCAAVATAHRNLVVHRDLKPSNILVTAEGFPKLLDFGIAKLLDADHADLTVAAERVLTPRYASPEQMEGGPVTTASDVYSLGVLLHELLTGRLPQRERGGTTDEIVTPSQVPEAVGDAHEGTSANETAAARGMSPEALARRLQGDLDAICRKALEKPVGQRYSSVEELASDVWNHLNGLPVAARSGGFSYRFGKLVRRHRLAAAVLTALLASLLGFAGAMTVQSGRLSRQRDEAVRQGRIAAESATFLADVFRLVNPVQSAHATSAVEIVQRAARQVPDRFADEPELRREMTLTLAGIHRNLGLYKEAIALYKTALGEAEEQLGEDHPQVAEILRAFGVAELQAGERAEGLAALERGLMLRRRLGIRDRTAAFLLSDLASAYRMSGRAAEAIPLLEESLPLVEELVGHNHVDYAGQLAALASALNDFDQRPRAEELNREAVRVLSGLGPEFLIEKLTVQGNLATGLSVQGKTAEALPLLEEVLAAKRERLGPNHLSTLVTHQSLIILKMDEGLWEEALEEQRRLLAAVEPTLGPNHRRTVHALTILGSLLWLTHQPEAAEAAARRALDAVDPTRPDPALGPNDSKRITLLLGLIRVLVDEGRCGEAAPLIQRCLELDQSNPGRNGIELAIVQAEAALCAARQGQITKAHELIAEAGPALGDTPGPRWSQRLAQERLAAAEQLLLERRRAVDGEVPVSR